MTDQTTDTPLSMPVAPLPRLLDRLKAITAPVATNLMPCGLKSAPSQCPPT